MNRPTHTNITTFTLGIIKKGVAIVTGLLLFVSFVINAAEIKGQESSQHHHLNQDNLLNQPYLVWKEMAQFNTHPTAPWLINVTTLMSHLKANATVKDLTDRFYFTAKQQHLSIIDPKTGLPVSGQTSLNTALIDNKWLRLNGIPKHVFYLAVEQQYAYNDPQSADLNQP